MFAPPRTRAPRPLAPHGGRATGSPSGHDAPLLRLGALWHTECMGTGMPDPQSPVVPQSGSGRSLVRPRWVRAARRLIVAAVGLVIAAVLGANVFLNYGFSSLFSPDDQVKVTFRRAWTLWPTIVHVRDLRVVFEDHNVQFSLELARATVRLRLPELASRTFHATRVEGDGARFVMRHRIESGAAQRPWVSALPSIPEFRDPPLFEQAPPRRALAGRESKLWTVHLEQVAVGVEEVWVQTVRYRGSAVARGAFRLIPAAHLWVGPASLTLERGTLAIGEAPLAEGVSGTIDCVVHPFAVRSVKGREVFRHISSRVELLGAGFRVDPVGLFLDGPFVPSLRASPGTLRIGVHMERGRFTETSRIELGIPQATLGHSRYVADLNQVRVLLRGHGSERGQLRAEVASAVIRVPGTEVLPLSLSNVSGWGNSSSLDATRPWSITEAELEVQKLLARDLAFFEAATRRPEPRMGGALRLRGRLRYAAGEVSASAEAELQGVRSRVRTLGARVDGVLELELARLRWAEKSGRLLAKLHADSTQVETGTTAVHAHGVAAQGTIEASRGRASGDLSGVLAGLAVESGGSGLETAAKVRARLADLDLDTWEGQGSLELELERARGKAPELQLRARRAWLDAQVHHSDRGQWSVGLEAGADVLAGQWKQTSWTARPRLEGRVSEFSPAQGTGSLQVELGVNEFEAKGPEVSVVCRSARADWTRLSARVELGSSRRRWSLEGGVRSAELVSGDLHAAFDADFSLRAGVTPQADGEPQVGLEPKAGSEPPSPIADLAFSARPRNVRLRTGSSGAGGWEARIPVLVLNGALASTPSLRGAVTLEAERAEARIGSAQIRTDVHANGRIPSISVARREARIDGAVRLSETSVTTGAELVEDWWAHLETSGATVRAGEHLEVSAPLRAQLRDGTPGLTVLSAADQVPDWLVTLLPLRQLEVTGAITRRGQLTDWALTEVAGGPLTAKGRVQSSPDAARGALLVRLAEPQAVSVGIRFGSRTQVKLLAGESWLRTREEALDAAAEAAANRSPRRPTRQCRDEGAPP